MGSNKATSDILLYAEMVAPSVMRLKNGSLLTGFRIKGPDLESAPPEVWASSSAALNDALLTLDHGWTVHFETTRLPSSVSRRSDFLDPTCRLIDEERRRTLFFETEQWLFLTQAPPWSEQSPTLKNLKSWLYEEPRRSYEQELRTQLDRFDRTAERFQNSLCAHLQISRFRSEPDNDELLQALYHCLTGRWQRTRLPEAPVCLDVLLAEDWLQGDPLTLGKRLVRAITLRGYPSDTFPGVLSALRALPFEVRWSQRFIVKDYQQSEALLKKEQRRWQQRTRSFASQVLRTAGRLDQHALERANELDAALGDLNAGAVLYGHHTSVLLISGESPEETETRSALVERSVQTAGYIAHVETYNGLEAFIGSLPGHTRQNVRKPVIHSLNVADLLAISREWEGEPYSPSPFFSKRSPALAEVRSSSGARFFLNLHVGDVGHTLMLGPTGAGKSTLLAFLASQFLQYASQGAQVFAFDKGRSLFPLCAAVQDGAHVDFGAQVPELCPLENVHTPKERAWAGEWIEQLLLLQGAPIGAEERRALLEALETFGHSSRGGALSDFVTTLQDANMRTALSYYTGSGPGGAILDGSRTRLPDSPFSVFEIEDLMNMGPKIVNATLLYLFHYVETKLDGRPTLLLVDEAWLALSNPLFSDKLREWLKVLRKNNCAVVMATQSLSDVVNSPIRDAVFESCPTRLLLPNPEAQSAMMKKLYQEYLRLDDAQIALIAAAEKKRHYYYASPTGTRLFELNLGPTSLSFLGASSKPELAAVRRLVAADPEGWPEKWLRERGLEEDAARWRTAAGKEEEEQDDEPKTMEYRTLEHAMVGAESDFLDGPTVTYLG
jgi:type IV secretion system protein VirB4